MLSLWPTALIPTTLSQSWTLSNPQPPTSRHKKNGVYYRGYSFTWHVFSFCHVSVILEPSPSQSSWPRWACSLFFMSIFRSWISYQTLILVGNTKTIWHLIFRYNFPRHFGETMFEVHREQPNSHLLSMKHGLFTITGRRT